MKISVIGAGSWGTTLAIHLHRNSHEITMWEWDPRQAERLETERVNEIFLPGVAIPQDIRITNDLAGSILNAEIIVFAVPSHAMRATATGLNEAINLSSAVRAVVTVSKGLEVESLKPMSEVIIEENDGLDANLVCVLSGPSHAEEVSRGIPTAIVAASKSSEIAELVQKTFFSNKLRVYAGDDQIGVELGGALKNTIAIAAGICDGAGFGDNTKAALMTRGLAEMTRMAVALGAKESTLSGLAGMGDMIVTCLSKHSRNRYVGEEIGKGSKLLDVLDGMAMVAEGVKTTTAIKDLAATIGIEMPISQQVYEVLFEEKDPHQAVEDLMSRDPRME